MCGICGYISRNVVDEKSLLDMTNSMMRRGPDGYGTICKEMNDVYIGLGHRRLSIFDLSDRGKQPMESDDGDIAITYNGEIYNFRDIKSELILKGYIFKSKCDTEVILNAYKEWGVEAFGRFNGMFAFAILDRKNEKFLLCRDRIGVKPLYYHLDSKENFCFASELSALMHWPGFSKTIDCDALHFFLWSMYIPAPKTIFKDTYKLDPGSYLEISIQTGEKKIIRWWNPYDIYSREALKLSEYEWLERMESEISNAVKIRLEADVPVGVFLSGGIDSSLVTAFACATGKSINTFSIGFNEKEYDETQYAKTIAGILGTNHHTLYCSINDAKNLIKEIPKAYSEPFADNSQIPMLLLSRLTRENVTVALSGDGGDELFGGYPHIQESYMWFKNRWILSNVGKVLKKCGFLAKGDSLYSYIAWKINKMSMISSKRNIRNLDYLSAKNLVDSILGVNVLGAARDSVNIMLDIMESDLPDTDFLSQYLLRDMKKGLPDDMLTKVDRATMYYSLEARTPLLDYRIVEDAICMPTEIKYCGGTLKYILKEMLYKKVPKEIVDRPKRGFGIPINTWLHDDNFMSGFDEYFSEDWINRQGLFNNIGIGSLLQAFHSNSNLILDRLVWTYINFQMWWEEYIA